jgi:hypothetical protein
LDCHGTIRSPFLAKDSCGEEPTSTPRTRAEQDGLPQKPQSFSKNHKREEGRTNSPLPGSQDPSPPPWDEIKNTPRTSDHSKKQGQVNQERGQNERSPPGRRGRKKGEETPRSRTKLIKNAPRTSDRSKKQDQVNQERARRRAIPSQHEDARSRKGGRNSKKQDQIKNLPRKRNPHKGARARLETRKNRARSPWFAGC